MFALVIAFTSVVAAALNSWSTSRSDLRRRTYTSIKVGITIEDEITSVFGPPHVSYNMALTTEQLESRGLSPKDDGRPTMVMMKRWWYDDCQTFELEFDDQGHVRRNGGIGVDAPRSLFHRLWRECFNSPAQPIYPD
jgi:hypothetical protein